MLYISYNRVVFLTLQSLSLSTWHIHGRTSSEACDTISISHYRSHQTPATNFNAYPFFPSCVISDAFQYPYLAIVNLARDTANLNIARLYLYYELAIKSHHNAQNYTVLIPSLFSHQISPPARVFNLSPSFQGLAGTTCASTNRLKFLCALSSPSSPL